MLLQFFLTGCLLGLLVFFPKMIVWLIYLGDKEEQESRVEQIHPLLFALLDIGYVLTLISIPFLSTPPINPFALAACIAFPALLIIWAVTVRIHRATWKKKYQNKANTSIIVAKDTDVSRPASAQSQTEYTEEEFKKLPAWKRVELMQQKAKEEE